MTATTLQRQNAANAARVTVMAAIAATVANVRRATIRLTKRYPQHRALTWLKPWLLTLRIQAQHHVAATLTPQHLRPMQHLRTLQ